MFKLVIICTGFLLTSIPTLCAAQQVTLSTDVNPRSTLNQYCVACHNETLRTAGLSLEKIDVNEIGAGAEVWERVLRKLKARTMPPIGMPRPDIDTYDSFATYLESELDRYAQTHPAPTTPSLRRLNRTEYLNAVRDLLAVKVNDDNILPADDTMFGFDNVGKVLTLSPLLAEQYINAARVVRYQALGDPEMQPDHHINNVPMYLMQEDHLSEELPFGSRGGIAFEHHFPMDGEYEIQIRLQRNSREYIRGLLGEPHQIDVRVDGRQVSLFSIGGERHGRSSGIFSSSAQGDVEQEHYERNADDALVVNFPSSAGTRKVTVSFPKSFALAEEPLYLPMSIIDYAQYKAGVPGVRSVGIIGPHNPQVSENSPSRNKIYTCRPRSEDDVVCVRQIISTLASRAYRRPITDNELTGLMDFYSQGQRAGGFDEGIGLVIERILAGPRFLFITEEIPANIAAGEVFDISDFELATRLALFLWSSLPDEELLSIAKAGKLKDSAVLEQQVARMLADPRSQALVDNFASQWLMLRRLNASAPDGEQFPHFDDNLRRAFYTETALLFDYVFRNDRPLMELLSADYTFVNERLATHYGIENIYGSHFRKVSLEDVPRGGMLGHGSILTVTSYANRTAPTIRGKWVLENILSAPPPAPPANVPGLRERNDDGKVLNMRERMEQHRANPVCASCHKLMDPLGFALENYDAIGKWRTIDSSANTPIDPSGALPDGTVFEGPDGLREILVDKFEYDFVMTVVEKLMTYALGRGVNHHDIPAMRTIMRETAADDYNISSLIMAVIRSTPFKMRRAPGNDDL